MKDWEKWVRDNKHPKAARLVFAWLEMHDFDEPVWRAADDIVNLVMDVKECIEDIPHGHC